MSFLSFFCLVLTAIFGVTVWNHQQVTGGFSVIYLLVALFLSLNLSVGDVPVRPH